MYANYLSFFLFPLQVLLKSTKHEILIRTMFQQLPHKNIQLVLWLGHALKERNAKILLELSNIHCNCERNLDTLCKLET